MSRSKRNQQIAPFDDDIAFSTNHVAQVFGVDQSTLHHYVKRGLVSPMTVSSGRKVWRLEDLRVVAAYRRSRGLSDGGLLNSN